jgi:alkanesulfonate monooxygenase SsuD/methylene tetrahydromethanopterin reductase-like flavin-dependent oxidoreductase (luciferase family)|tara:strand:- start:3872 stop:4879 length:1008 start_codon:yes stop_codon:yes gene_type:complete
MKLSFGPWGETLNEFIEAGIEAEQHGFDTLWTSELHRTPFVPLTALAAKTSEIKLGSGVALAFLRSPLTLALTALDLNEISNGRFILGLGSGVKNLNEYWHDVRFGSPVKHIEDVINICRKVMKESHLNPIKYDGAEKSISLIGFDRPFIPQETNIPIYMGSVGPLMTKKCGEIANGWISHELCSPHYLKSNIIPKLEEGSGDNSIPKLVVSGLTVVDPDEQKAKRIAAGTVAFYASVKTYDEFFSNHGFGAEAKKIREQFKNSDIKGMIESVPNEMVDVFAIAGNRDFVSNSIKRYSGIVDEIKLTPPTHYVTNEETRYAQKSILSLVEEGEIY